MTLLVPAPRDDLIDALRGVALIGIIIVNMQGHALPFYALWNPLIAGGEDLSNLRAWTGIELFVEGAMRGLFSLLFGASVLLFLRERKDRREDLFFRRNLLLVVFGLIHGLLLLMPGDILYTYGLCAFLLFAARDQSPEMLFAAAAALLAITCAIEWTNAADNAAVRAAAEAALARGAQTGPEIEAYRALLWPTEEALEELNAAARAGYPKLLPLYAQDYGRFILSPAFLAQLADALTMMLTGMGMLKSGWLVGAHGARMALFVGVALVTAGLALRAFALNALLADRFMDDFSPAGEAAAEAGRVALAVGYAQFFAGAWRAGAAWIPRRALSALGRTAFTHYIGGTLVASVLFYGHGFGLYGALSRIEILGVIAIVVAAQIAFSMAWLARFRAGPLEWAWRSLTYGRRQALRR